jgi:hypothetical protein
MLIALPILMSAWQSLVLITARVLISLMVITAPALWDMLEIIVK